MRSHWENMTEALQVADYPALEELELELEMDMDAIACDAVLCVSNQCIAVQRHIG